MSIDIGSAAFSGFGVIARRPLSVLIWGLLYLILLGVPMLYLLSQVGPQFLELVRTAAAAKAAGQTTSSSAVVVQMLALMQSALGLGLLIFLLSLIVRGVLTTAVLRAVLEPDNQGFSYLRIGGQEGRQILLSFALWVLLTVIYIGISIVNFVLHLVLHSMGSIGALLGFVVSLGALLLQVYFALRFSMAPAMTFREKKFRLFESWTMTRGHVGALFVIALILCVIIIVFEFVVGGGIFAYAISKKDAIRAQIQGNPDPIAFFKSLGPLVAIGVSIGSLFAGALLSIFLAPFATVYKQLTPAAAASEVF